MLGCAFFVFLIGNFFGLTHWWMPLGFGVAWFIKRCFQYWDSREDAATDYGKDLMHFRIEAGFEAYSPEPLTEGLRCKVIVRGMDDYHHYRESHARLDAVYLLGSGQYERHHSLRLDGPVAEVLEEDPHNHQYTFLYTGTGRHVSVYLLLPPEHARVSSQPKFDPPMHVTIRTLSQADEIEIATRLEQKQRDEQKEFDRHESRCLIQAHIERQEKEKAAKIEQQELHRRAVELAVAAHADSNFLDAEFQQNFAVKHTGEILRALSDRWRREYLDIMQNERLHALLQAEQPQVLEWLEARMTVTRLAQRLAVDPKQLTPEEWTARIERYRQRSLMRKRVKFEDDRAVMLQNLDMLLEFVDDLARYPLDEDERERLIIEFKERMLGGEDENSNGFRQL
jgi:hypothetical protein